MTQITTEKLTYLLESVFTTSFKHTSRVLYMVSFETSNVIKTIEKINELEYNFSNGIKTNKHVGAQITLNDITLVKSSLETLVTAYQLINNIDVLPSKLKLHEMLKEIRESEKPDIRTVAKEVVIEILNPSMETKKLTKKEKLAEDVSRKSNERKLKIIKKHGKQSF
jgi:hypothetical protein